MQNIIDGLGITGYEGIFLRVCEIMLSVLRTHRETLMSVLETFIHDPLVEWTKSHKSSGVEVQNPHAQVWNPLFFISSKCGLTSNYKLYSNYEVFPCILGNQ